MSVRNGCCCCIRVSSPNPTILRQMRPYEVEAPTRRKELVTNRRSALSWPDAALRPTLKNAAILGAMKTEFYESDPFAPRKAELLVSLESDYRFEKGDEVVIDNKGKTTKVRVMDVRIHVKNEVLSREILALKL